MIHKLLSETNTIQSGHFMLSSGLHSNSYVQCAKLIQNPSILHTIVSELNSKLYQDRTLRNTKIHAVMGPAYGGIILAHKLAGLLGARSLFTERVDNKMVLRRGQDLNPGENVLIIDDVLTTGTSYREVEPVVYNRQAHIVGFACIIDRSCNLDHSITKPVYSLINLDIPTYPASDCPMCLENVAITKPGSRI